LPVRVEQVSADGISWASASNAYAEPLGLVVGIITIDVSVGSGMHDALQRFRENACSTRLPRDG
jgi:hypothetical protein